MHFFKQQLIVKVLGTSLVFLIFTIASHQVFASNVLSATGERISPFWTTHYPQLAAIEKIMPPSNNQISPSQISLVGNITNPFGIRDEILKIIVDTIPADNEAALYHAIRTSQYDQAKFLANDAETINRNNIDQDAMYAGYCLFLSYKKNYELVKKIDPYYEDTPERKKQQRRVEKLIFVSGSLDTATNYEEKCRIGGKY